MDSETTSNEPALTSYAKQTILYFVKGFCLVGFLFALSRFEASLPIVVIAIVWAALSSISSVGLTYHVVIRKIHKQVMLTDSGLPGKVNEGRFLSLLIAFVVSAILVAGLMFEAVKWSYSEWVILIASVPIFFVAMGVAKLISKKSYEPFYQRSKAILINSAIVGALLCVIYFIVSSQTPPVTYASAAEAYLAAGNPFADSPSILLHDAGMINAFIDGSIAYALSQVAEGSVAGYVALKAFLGASALFGFASLLGTCSISHMEIKRVFQPLAAAKDANADQSIVPRYIASACIFPLVLILALPICNLVAEKATETEEYNCVETFIRDKIGIAAYLLDGKYYDQQAVEALIEEARQKSRSLSDEAVEKLTPLINEAYDKRVDNVDAYLDWYYSLPADYDRLIQFFAGSIEDGMKAQLEEKINEGVEDSELSEVYDDFIQQATDLEEDMKAKLDEHELKDIPAFLIVERIDLSPEFLSEPMKPAEELLETRQRFGVSAVAGIGSGLIAKSVVEHILAKETVGEMANRLVAKLGSSGIVKVVTSATGTAIAPGVGTVAGIGIGVLSDYLFLKADEAWNRDAYRQELIDAIEEDRQEKLDQIEGIK